jgi:hypothetical protein
MCRKLQVASLLLSALLVLAAPAWAEADGGPSYGGLMAFPSIAGQADPEDFTWEVRMSADQRLVQVDDRHAEVAYEGGGRAFLITAEAAHDADGSAVPTSLFVSAGNLVTLVVHHRAGDPAKGGMPFDYPVSAGAPYETDYTPGTAAMPPAEARTPASPARQCVVPALRDSSLQGSRERLREAGCALGEVTRRRRAGAGSGRVVVQDPRPGAVLPESTRIAVTLGARPHRR